MITAAQQSDHRRGDSCHAGREGRSGDTFFHCGDSVLQCRDGGIELAPVVVARLLTLEYRGQIPSIVVAIGDRRMYCLVQHPVFRLVTAVGVKVGRCEAFAAHAHRSLAESIK